MGMCSDPPPPPDMSGHADAMMAYADNMRSIADNQLAWSKEQYAQNREILNRVLDTQLPIMEQNAQNAQEDREFYEKNYRPLELDLIKEFQEYDSPERREKEAGEAVADVTTAFESQRENASRRLESYGIDPSQTQSQALDAGVRIEEAAAQAGAANMARRRVEATGRALRGEAINIGKGYAGNVAGAYSTALNAGQGAVGGANQTFATGSNAMNSAIGNYGQVASGISGSANITNAGYQNQLAAYDSGNAMMGAIVGGVAGAATSMISEGGEVVAPEVDIDRSRPAVALPPPEAINPGAVSRYSAEASASDAFQAGLAAGKRAKARGNTPNKVGTAHRTATRDDGTYGIASSTGVPLNTYLNDPQAFANGGQVVGPGTGTSDSVPAAIQAPGGAAPARLSDGEYVVPADVVKWKGLEFFEKQIQNSKKAMSERTLETPNGGRTGVVPPPPAEGRGVDINRERPPVNMPPPQMARPQAIPGYARGGEVKVDERSYIDYLKDKLGSGFLDRAAKGLDSHNQRTKAEIDKAMGKSNSNRRSASNGR